jgi:lipopolysaccharide transport system permease protein
LFSGCSLLRNPGIILNQDIKHTIQARHLIWDLARRELKLKFQGSLMGQYWNIFHPIVMIVLYTVIFSHVMGVRVGQLGEAQQEFPYAIFLCSALLPWNAFNEMTQRLTTVYQEFGPIMKKVKFPLFAPHLSLMIAITTTQVVSMILFVIYYLIKLKTLPIAIIYLPFVIVLQLMLAGGIGLLTSAINAFFRDAQQLLGIFFQLLFWATPIVYRPGQIPEAYQWILNLNPVAHLVAIYRGIFLGSDASIFDVAYIGVFAGVMLFVGVLITLKAKPGILDQI